MNLFRFRQAVVTCTALLFISTAPAQEQGGDKVDLEVLNQIKAEAFQNSQVMENLYYISEVYGPRVTNSRNHRAAAEWAMQQMKAWGLQNVHLEKWGPFGKGWNLELYSGNMLEPQYQPIIAMPQAWTAGTDGVVTGNPILVTPQTQAEFDLTGTID